MVVTQCYLIRHAESVLNRQNVLQGWANPELSEDGVAQAERLRGLLPLWPIFTSDLHRAFDTARLLAQPTQQVHRDARLREINAGEWQGMPKSSLEELPLWQNYQLSPGTFQFPQGESLNDLQTRMLEAFEDYVALHRQFIIVSHRLALRSLLCYFHGWSLDRIHTIDIPNGAIIRVQVMDDSSNVSIEQIRLNH